MVSRPGAGISRQGRRDVSLLSDKSSSLGPVNITLGVSDGSPVCGRMRCSGTFCLFPTSTLESASSPKTSGFFETTTAFGEHTCGAGVACCYWSSFVDLNSQGTQLTFCFLVRVFYTLLVIFHFFKKYVSLRF